MRLYPIITEQVFFHFDSARDWLWVRDIVMSKKPPLVGPWSSLVGVFYGPFTYYLLVPLFVLFQGDPIGGSVYALLVQLVALTGLYVWIRKNWGFIPATISLFLLLLSPLTANIATFIFQSNPSFGLGVLWLWVLSLLGKRKDVGVVLAMMTLGLGVHTNLLFTLFLLPFLGVLLLIKKWRFSRSLFFWSSSGLFLPLLPQIVFELRHGFIQTQSLWSFVVGYNTSLGVSLNVWERLLDRGFIVLMIMNEFLTPFPHWATVLLLTGISLSGYFFWRKGIHPTQKWVIGVICLSIAWFLLISLTFNGQLKLWYMYWMLPMLAALLGWWWDMILRRGRLHAVLTILVIVGIGIVHIDHVTSGFRSHKQDTKLLRQQKRAVEQVMAMGSKETYAAYVYTEPVYDYPYQYLFWWQWQKNGKGPVAYGYLPDKYDYVLNKKRYDPDFEPVKIVYLIMEKDNPSSDYRWETWLKAFYEFTPTERFVLPSGITIEKRVR